MLVFGKRGKPEKPGKNPLEKSREPTNLIHVWQQALGIERRTHWWKASALATMPTLVP